MAYSAPLTATLSGVTVSQLAYWRRETVAGPPLLVPKGGTRPRALYSYQDVVALRMFARIRNRDGVPLQKVRKAVSWLNENHPKTHLSAHALKADPSGRTIWISQDDDVFDIADHPGQLGIKVVLDEVFAAFESRNGQVPRLDRPAKGLSVDPDVRGGFPVLENSRVPYTIIAGLQGEGLGGAAIRELYPAATDDAIEGARALADAVAAREASSPLVA